MWNAKNHLIFLIKRSREPTPTHSTAEIKGRKYGMMRNGDEKMHPLKGATKRKYARIVLLCKKYLAVRSKEGKKENLTRRIVE